MKQGGRESGIRPGPKAKRQRTLPLLENDQAIWSSSNELDRAVRREDIELRMPEAVELARSLRKELNDRQNFPRKKVVYAFARILGDIIGPVFELEAFLNACEIYDPDSSHSRIDALRMRKYMLSLTDQDGTPVFPRVDYPHAHALCEKINALLNILRRTWEGS